MFSIINSISIIYLFMQLWLYAELHLSKHSVQIHLDAKMDFVDILRYYDSKWLLISL